MGHRRVVVIDAGEAIHLDVDQARSKIAVARSVRWFDIRNETIEREVDGIAGRDVDAGTFHRVTDLYTLYSHLTNRRFADKPMRRLDQKNLLKSRSKPPMRT